jgi:signal transduction histidine kinase/ActR/RegA family two-component response regulator
MLIEDVMPNRQLQDYLAKAVNCHDEISILSSVDELIKPLMDYQDCIILNQSGHNHFKTIGSDNDQFFKETWPECNLFLDAKKHGHCLSLYPHEELEFALLDNDAKKVIKTVLVVHIEAEQTHGLFIFTNVDVKRAKLIADSFAIQLFLQQIFFSLMNIKRQQVNISQSMTLINDFSALSLLFKELASEWFWKIDVNSRFVPVNSVENKDSFYTQCFLNKTVAELKQKSSTSCLDKWALFEEILTNKEDFSEIELELFTPKHLWVCLSGKIQFDDKGDFIGYLGIAKNITAAKDKEEALELEKVKAIEASLTKSKFLTVMSHEIRTPMNAIMGMIELLKDTELSDDQSQWLDYANSSADILYGLITNVLDFSKIELGTVLLVDKAFDIQSLIESTVGQIAIIKQSDDIIFRMKFDGSLPRYVYGDEFRLGQIFFNVIENAFKFTKHGRICLTVSMEDGCLTFSVADSGIGIAKKDLPLIFQPFRQVDDRMSRDTEGVGLGLSISKNLIELMNGSISIETQLGFGSTFTISIPMREASGLQVRESTHDSSSSLSILVAEDNKTNQVLIKAFLEKLNHKVTIANHGEEVIELMKMKPFNLILMDIMMPIMDGLTATGLIRDELHSDIPIFALTANAAIEDKALCFRAGMNKVLTKPIKLDTLKDALASLVEKQN